MTELASRMLQNGVTNRTLTKGIETMKLTRYDYPKLLGGFDDWFADPFSRSGNLSRLLEGFFDRPELSGDSRLATDIYEDAENYYARFEIPGVKKEELNVEVDGGVLTVGFNRKVEEDTRGETTSFRRAIRLPEGVDAGKITAKLVDGILTVTVAKAEERKPRTIEVD